jgi:photosystem II stability/assembly factor-like uncharacterized protein
MANPLTQLLGCIPRGARRQPLAICLLFTLSCVWLSCFPAQGSQQTKITRRTNKKSQPKARPSPKRLRTPAPKRARIEREAEGEEDVEARASWFRFKRAYPFDSIPLGARRIAWATRPQKLKSAQQSISGEGQIWTSIGPTPTVPFPTPMNFGGTSGRVNAVAVSPANTQIVLVGASTGGIWRSVDGGANFSPVGDDQVDLAVGWIAFAPSNPTIVYAGMGDFDHDYLGSGVLKSVNSGQTWIRVSNSSLPEGVTARLEVDPTNPDRVYLAQKLMTDRSSNTSSASGVYVSSDGGVNWIKTLAGQARDVVIHPTNPQILYAGLAARSTLGGAGQPSGLYRSTDSGTTWTNIPLNLTGFHADLWDIRIALTPADPQRVYVYFGTIFFGETRLQVSLDGGATWQTRSLANVDSGQFGYNTYLSADPTNPGTVYLGSRDLYKSANAGGLWINLTKNFSRSGNNWVFQPSLALAHADQQAFAFEPGNSSVVYLANDGGIWKSTDGASTFQSMNSTLSLVQFNSLAIHPTDAAFSIGGVQDNGTQVRLKDSANAPTVQWRDFGGSDGGDCVINPENPSVIFATWFAGYVNRYRISGNNFVFEASIGDLTSWGDSRIAFYPPFTGNEVDQRIYFGSWRLFVSNNLGASWTTPGGPTDLTKGGNDVLSEISVSRSNTNVIYTGSSRGRAMVSANGGTSWTDITPGLPNRFIEDIAIDPANSEIAYLSVSGFGSGHIFKTTDRGASWVDVSGALPNVPVNALLVDPLNSAVIYAGSDIGVFRSTTGGNGWESFNDGLAAVPIAAFAAQAGGKIQVATYGRGAYELRTVGPSSIGFGTSSVGTPENSGSVTLTVIRTGDLSLPAQVNYATVDGSASDRSDYTVALGTLRYEPGETSHTIEVFITNDVLSEPIETFSVSLSNPVNMTLGSVSSATVNITSDDVAPLPNPVRWDANFDSTFFVRQHYVDFFSREPDAAGLAFWKNQIDECETRPAPEQQQCREVRRINVSAAFFLSIEFQQTGYLVYRAHQAAFNTAETLSLRNFMADAREIGRGIIVGEGDWQARSEAHKVAFFREFVLRQQFINQYQGMSNSQYVDALNGNTATSLTAAERDALVAGLDAGTQTRATALRAVAENQEFGRRHFNRAFVLMQYFGYLRRNPPDPPEPTLDFAGYNFWLTKLNQFGGNFVNAEMVKAFITSTEYQQRFGP